MEPDQKFETPVVQQALPVPAPVNLNVVQHEPHIVDLESERRQQSTSAMEKMEKDFQQMKESFFNSKIEALSNEYESIKNGQFVFFFFLTKKRVSVKRKNVNKSGNQRLQALVADRIPHFKFSFSCLWTK